MNHSAKVGWSKYTDMKMIEIELTQKTLDDAEKEGLDDVCDFDDDF